MDSAPEEMDEENDMRHARAAGSGRPLDPVTRATMEAHLGADLRDVRVHDEAHAAQATATLHAAAFTTGRDVFFAASRYRPGTPAGRRLLAHELNHVLQQRYGAVSHSTEGGAASDAFERQAERWANRVADDRAWLVDRHVRGEAAAFERPWPELAEPRCSREGNCPDDPLTDYQGSGETTCDRSTGAMSSTVTEHCAGDCVALHEGVHRRDRAPCCRRVKLCFDAAGADAGRLAACTTAFLNWYPTLDDWTECNAYRTEVQCLNAAIQDHCGPGGTASRECCRALRTERSFARFLRRMYCPSAQNSPCPFRADGSLPTP
jgi:hypothetical protein